MAKLTAQSNNQWVEKKQQLKMSWLWAKLLRSKKGRRTRAS